MKGVVQNSTFMLPGCADNYIGYDMVTRKTFTRRRYDCEDYKAQCRSDYTSDWSKQVRAACKNTCSQYASEYCNQNTCKGEKHDIMNAMIIEIWNILMHVST